MATSGDYTVTMTASDLINDVFIDIGVIGTGETATDAELQHAIRALNLLIKQLEGPPNFITPAKKMWQRETATLTLDSTKNSYSLKPSGGDLAIQIPIEIIAVLLRHKTNNTDSPLKEIDYDQYLAIGAKSASGTPTKYYAEQRTDELKLYFDLKPSSDTVTNYNGIIYYRQPIEVISSSANTFDFKPEYFRVLRWTLAKELAAAPSYSSKVDFQIVADMATEALMVAKTFEPETYSGYFEPERDD